MGLEVTTLNIQNIEKRYMELKIRKGDGVGEAFITVETGYYSDNINKKGWVKIISEEIHLPNDLLNVLVSMNHTKLGIPVDKVSVGALLETLVYGIIGGQIPITAKVTILTKDSSAASVDTTLRLKYKGVEIFDNPFKVGSTHVFDFLPVMLGVEVIASAPGYMDKSLTIGSWYGERTSTIVLSPVPTTTSAPTTTNTPESIDNPTSEPAQPEAV